MAYIDEQIVQLSSPRGNNLSKVFLNTMQIFLINKCIKSNAIFKITAAKFYEHAQM